MTPDGIKIAAVCVYFLALMGIAVVASRRIFDISDYFVGGKKLNYWVVSFSSRATGESSWLLLGLTGMGFALGAHALWVLMGEMLGVVCAWVFVTQRFKSLTDRYKSITVPDYLESRFHDTSHVIRIFSAIVLVVFVTAYLSAQLQASGKAFDTFLGVPYHWGVVLGLAIILFYTVAGGFVAVAWSDFLQGALMVVGLVALPVVALTAIGGLAPLMDGLRSLDSNLLAPMGAHGWGLKGWLSALGLVSIGLGYLGSPQILVRFMALRDIKEVRQGAVVAAFWTLFADAGAILTGMCGRVILKTLADQEAVLPTLVNQFFHPVIVGIFIAVVLAAIMSTADSLLILASSAVVRDFYQKVWRPRASDKSLTNVGRFVTVCLCVGALAFAMDKESTLIFWFVLFGWAGISAVFTPVVVLSLFWKGMTRAGALAGMFAGFVVTIVWNSVPVGVYKLLIPGFSTFLAAHGFADIKTLSGLVYEILPAMIAATAAAVVVSRLTEPPEHAARDLRELESRVVDVWR